VFASLLWMLSLLGQVADPAQPDAAAVKLAERVKKLVVQLDDDSQARRDAAEQALVAIGPDLLDVLPPPGEKASIELRARLARVRGAVENAHIEASARPSEVTLQGSMKLSEAVAKIAEQTGNKVVDGRERFNQESDDLTVELDLDGVPFWKALDTLLDEAELTLYNYNDQPHELLFMNRTPGETSRSERGTYAGLFRLEAKSIGATRDLRNPTGNGLRITADIAWEPRVRPIVLAVPLARLQATDENGASIASSGEGEIEVPIESSNAGVEIDFNLDLPERSVKKIAQLQGEVTALVPGRVETFTFANLPKTKDSQQQRGGAVVTLEQVRKNEDVHEVRMRVKFDKAANALESHRGWIYNNEAYLLDAAGKRIDNNGVEARLVEENEIGLAYLFDLTDVNLAQARFVYKTPAALFKVPVPFELRDLELP
jgi:hypothetical protein